MTPSPFIPLPLGGEYLRDKPQMMLGGRVGIDNNRGGGEKLMRKASDATGVAWVGIDNKEKAGFRGEAKPSTKL